ncbi:MAG: ATP-binding protein [Candidatus Omnitrophota bacterium]
MKISAKIILLISILLLVFAINGAISFRLLKGVSRELQAIVNQDLVLLQTSTSITKRQLQKAVILERLRRIAEELAYQQVTPARKEHLLFHIKLARNDFDNLAKEGAIDIINAKRMIEDDLRQVKDAQVRKDLEQVSVIFKEIEKAHIHYDAVSADIFRSIDGGNFEISTEAVDQIHTDEGKLTRELKKLLDDVQTFAQVSVANARNYEKTTERVLWLMFSLSLLAGFLLSLSIIRGINRPLRHLLKATHEVGGGNLSIKLDDSSRDELGELSHEFNRMSTQLADARASLEEQRKALQDNLDLTARQKKDLEKVNQELDRFVHTVSHDIRSPLMGIAWYVDFLKSHHYDKIDKKGQDSIDGVCRGVERANALISDLLALTRISRIHNPYQEIPVRPLVEEVVSTLDYKISQNNVAVFMPDAMPLIVCDPIKIKEVFLNLMTNAIKFSSGRPDIRPEVRIECRKAETAVEFIVRDNGIGIPAASHAEVFEIFRRLDTSEKYEGTGAGLSIVKSVVEDHGGKVWVVSEEGRGSAFHFTIPVNLKVAAA